MVVTWGRKGQKEVPEVIVIFPSSIKGLVPEV
jgi:hypothetical protein